MADSLAPSEVPNPQSNGNTLVVHSGEQKIDIGPLGLKETLTRPQIVPSFLAGLLKYKASVSFGHSNGNSSGASDKANASANRCPGLCACRSSSNGEANDASY